MKTNTSKLKVSLLTAALMSMPLMGYAISNPFAQSSTGATTNSTASSDNTATQGGLAAARNSSIGNRAPEGSGNTANYGSSANFENTATESGNLKDAVENCEIVEAHEEAQVNAVKMAALTPNIDEIFNSASEQAKGCFASSKEIINLAVEIPNITSSWSAISAAIQQRVQKIMQDKVTEVLDKGCKIAQEAMHESMSPIIGYVDEFNANTKNASNSIFGNMQVDRDSSSYSLGDVLGDMDLEFNKDSNTQARSTTVPNVSNAGNTSTFSAPTARNQPSTYGANTNYPSYDDGGVVGGSSAPQAQQQPQFQQPTQQPQAQQPQQQQPAPVPTPVPAPKPINNSVAPNPFGNGG